MSVGLPFSPHTSSSLDDRRKGWSFSTLPETMRERLQEMQNTLADWLESQSLNKAQSVLATVDWVQTLKPGSTIFYLWTRPGYSSCSSWSLLPCG